MAFARCLGHRRSCDWVSFELLAIITPTLSACGVRTYSQRRLIRGLTLRAYKG
jgi:hypothetical protein